MPLRSYRLALIASVLLNVILISLIWLYIHYEGFYSTIQSIIEIMG